VLISAAVFGGIPERAIKKAFSKTRICVSPQLLKEYRETPFELKRRGKITDAQLRALLSGIASFVANANVTVSERKLSLCRDRQDNMVLECCLAANADFLITGDKDLLEIDKAGLKAEVPRLRIVSPRDFLEAEQ
jgi:putative PIN family toxin of toxin-antitoxin system